MKKAFVKTKNVKKFVALMSELQELPPNIPKIALVFGDYGLGKSETIKWWTFKNECIYIRANQGMTTRWLLSEIADELNIQSYWHINETFKEIESALLNNRQTIIIDEIDYLIERKVIETLRDLHDRTGCPMVLVGMNLVNKKLARYPHLMDIIREACKKAGLQERIGTHTMRKTFGYHHYQQFKDVVLLQKIFNHSSPQITLRYIGIEQDQIDYSYNNFIL